MAQEVTLCTTSEVARRFAVDAATVRRWVAKGQIHAVTTTPGGQYRFDLAEIDRLLKVPA